MNKSKLALLPALLVILKEGAPENSRIIKSAKAASMQAYENLPETPKSSRPQPAQFVCQRIAPVC